MIGHVEIGGRHVLDGRESLIEPGRCTNLVDNVLRDLLAGLVVLREHPQYLGFAHPVLHDLRRKFDEVARCGGAGQ